MKTFLVTYKYDNEVFIFLLELDDETQIDLLKQAHDNNTNLDPLIEEFILKFPQLYENDIVYQQGSNLPMPHIDKHIDYIIIMGM